MHDLYLIIELFTVLLCCPFQTVPGGEGPVLRLGLQAAPMHHVGGQFQHEPVEAEHHRLSGKSGITAALPAGKANSAWQSRAHDVGALLMSAFYGTS